MKRYTVKPPNGITGVGSNYGVIQDVIDIPSELFRLFDKLGAYEDTGLNPEEITYMKLPTGWIPVEERLPGREEWMGNKDEEHYLRRMEIAIKSDTFEYFLVFYDGYKWFDKYGRVYSNVIAWKVHEPFNP